MVKIFMPWANLGQAVHTHLKKRRVQKWLKHRWKQRYQQFKYKRAIHLRQGPKGPSM